MLLPSRWSVKFIDAFESWLYMASALPGTWQLQRIQPLFL